MTGDVHPVTEQLRLLYEKQRDNPSMRHLAEVIGCSHATVYDALTGRGIPSMRMCLRIVEALDGDAAVFRELYRVAPKAPRRQNPTGPQMVLVVEELRAIRRLLEDLSRRFPGAPT